MNRAANAGVVLLSAWAATGLLSAAVPAATPIPQSARWIDHDLVVHFANLPTRYSCEDLQRKSRDILEAIGARPQIIFPYECERSLGTRARSPQVHVRFWFPELVSAPPPSTARLSVVRETVQLKPGNPPALGNSDCELLRQLKNALLSAVPLTITTYRLACAAPARFGKPPFELTVSTLATAVNSDSKLAAGPLHSSPE